MTIWFRLNTGGFYIVHPSLQYLKYSHFFTKTWPLLNELPTTCLSSLSSINETESNDPYNIDKNIVLCLHVLFIIALEQCDILIFKFLYNAKKKNNLFVKVLQNDF